jgi:hypothetical protein
VSNPYRWVALGCAAALLFTAACSSSSNSSTSNSAASESPAAVASAAPNGMMGGGMAERSPAPIPSGLHCGTGTMVWVNLSRKDYHLPGDRFYGMTKNGKYMCQSDAEAAGYKMAGMRGHTSSMTSPQPSST